MSLIVYLENDNLIVLEGLADAISGAYVNTAAVSVTLKDATGANIAGETWPVTMSYVAASNGLYRGLLRDTLALTSQRQVTARIVADDGTDRRATWEIPLTVRKRTE